MLFFYILNIFLLNKIEVLLFVINIVIIIFKVEKKVKGYIFNNNY